MTKEINNMSTKAIEVKNAMEEALQSCRTIGGKILRGEKATIKSRCGYEVEKTVWLDGDVVKVLVKCESEGVAGLYTSSPKPIKYDLRHFRDFMSGNISEYDDSKIGCIGGNLKPFVRNILNNLSGEILEIIHRADLITIEEHCTDKEAIIFDDLNNYYIEKLEIIHEIENIEATDFQKNAEKYIKSIAEKMDSESEYGVTVNTSICVEIPYYDKNIDKLVNDISIYTKYIADSYDEDEEYCYTTIHLRLKDGYIKENAEKYAKEIIDYDLACGHEEGVDDDVNELTWSFQKEDYAGYLGAIIQALADMGWEFTDKHYFNKWHYNFKKIA